MATDDWVPISALEHYSYCPRQCALILVDGIWSDNEHTVRGERGHRRADQPGARRERGRVVSRAVPLFSERLRLNGRADAVEITDEGVYKIGRRHGDAATIQLCAEALCLEEMLGLPVPLGYLWFSATRRRERVEFGDGLRRQTVEMIEAVRQLRDGEPLPVAVDDERCRHCQLAGHCLPSVVADEKRVAEYLSSEVYSCDS
jgi:CRISPR-associated exonuclease Cas4